MDTNGSEQLEEVVKRNTFGKIKGGLKTTGKIALYSVGAALSFPFFLAYGTYKLYDDESRPKRISKSIIGFGMGLFINYMAFLYVGNDCQSEHIFSEGNVAIYHKSDYNGPDDEKSYSTGETILALVTPFGVIDQWGEKEPDKFWTTVVFSDKVNERDLSMSYYYDGSLPLDEALRKSLNDSPDFMTYDKDPVTDPLLKEKYAELLHQRFIDSVRDGKETAQSDLRKAESDINKYEALENIIEGN